ncbi:MAG: hypothetical protein ABSA83_16910 [Verrucomicrobiota bacterium]
MNNALKPLNYLLKTALLAALAFSSTLAQAQLPSSPHAGDWASEPGTAPSGLQGGGGGCWDNSTSNSLGTYNTWEYYTGSAWVQASGNVVSTSSPYGYPCSSAGYPTTTNGLNSGLVTILSGTTISNSSTGAATFTFDGLVVQSGATFLFADGTNILGSSHTPDMDVFGNFGVQNSDEPLFFMNTGATIVMENGSTMTNNGNAANDNFTGLGYTNNSGYVAGAITFKSGSTYVQQFNGTSTKGWIPHATWLPGSTCLIAPTLSTGFVPKGLPGQTFYDFIWNWPNETAPGKFGSTAEQGSFTIAHNFYMTASGLTCTNSDFPNTGYSLTVGGNIGLTNVTWAPTGSAGAVTLNVGGNLLVDSTAVIKINNGSAVGNVTFDGSSPQTLGIYGDNASPAGWNWTVNSGSTVNLDSALVVNAGDFTGTVPSAGFVNINGILNFTANGTLSGTSNTITLGGSGAEFNISADSGGWTFAGEDTLEGSGTVVGEVTASSTSVILPGSLSAGATLTFDGSLTYGGAASTNIFTLNGTPGSAGNSQIVVSGGPGSILHPNGAQIILNPIGTLSTSTSYVLYNVTGGGTVSASTFAPSLAWVGTPPGNAAQFNIATNAAGTQVVLQFGTPVAQPDITSFSVSGANLTVNINNAVSGTQYTVLRTTDLTTLLSSWSPVGTFTPGSSGSYSAIITNAINPSLPAQYFVLKAP